MVWLRLIATNFSANVVLTIEATAADGRTLHQSYRGETVKINWANGSSEMEDSIDRAFADALNKMAPDLRQLCRPAAAN